jgi:hypothetical protein
MSRNHPVKRSENPIRIRLAEDILEEVREYHRETMPDAYQENVLAHLIRRGLRAEREETHDIERLRELDKRLEEIGQRIRDTGGGHGAAGEKE